MRRDRVIRSCRQVLLGAVLVALLLAANPADASNAQGCGITLSVQTSQINLPSNSIPAPGQLTFAQEFYVNYTFTFSGAQMLLQYFNGSTWQDLFGFSGNGVGFTAAGYGLDNTWAHFGTNSVRVQSGECTSDPVSFSVGADPGAAVTDVAVYAALAAVAVAFLFAGRRLGWKRFLILAVPVYLALSPWTGQRYDVYFLLSSGIRILQHVNPFDPGNPGLYPGPLKWAYPPLYTLYSAFSFLMYQVVAGAHLPSVSALTWPGWLTSTYDIYLAFVPSSLPVLVFLLKLPMVAAAIITGVLLKKMTGSESAAIWWVANPLVLLVAAVWGQLDPIATLFAVGALYYYQKEREDYAYLLASFGAAVKVWPALLIPIMLVVSARKRGWGALKPVAAILPAALLTVALYASYGDLVNSLFVFIYARGIPTFAGAFSVNGLTWQQVLFVMNSPPVPVFLYVGIPAFAAILAWAYWKSYTDTVELLTVFLLIFFLTYNYVNPQYFYWILPLFILKRNRAAAIAFTAVPLVYLFFGYNVFYFVSPALLSSEFSLGASVLEQMKVSFFYQTTAVYLAVSAAAPTVLYLWALVKELRGGSQFGRRGRAPRLEDAR